MKNFYRRFKMIVLIFLLLFFGVLAFTVRANTPVTYLQQQVNGRVTNAAGEALEGVSVTIKGESKGTITNNQGRYSISAGKNDILVFSYLGYKRLERTINNQSIINISLNEEATSLKAIKLNAGYYSVKEKESTGSISRLQAEAIEQQPISNPIAALQGRMPGVNITQTSGVPGGGFDIQIRGINSLREGANSPLYIIDGVPFNDSSLSDTNLSRSLLPGDGNSVLNTINPSDIASIEVLKDADATAIYGSRGANGVVLITTKKGVEGKSRLKLNFSSGFGEVSQKLDLLNTPQYLQMRREAFTNDGISQIPVYAYDVNGTWSQDRYTDWQEILLGGTAEIYDASASFSGGSKTTSYYLSGGHRKETTVFPGDFSNKKTSVHLNLNHTSEDKRLKLNFSGSYVSDNNDLLSTDLTSEAGRLAPNAPEVYNEDGSLNWENSTWNNPLRLLEGEYRTKTNNLVVGTLISYEILPGLELRSNFGYNRVDFDETRTSPSSSFNPAYGLGSEYSSVYLNNAERSSWLVEPQLNFKTDIGKGELNLLAGATFQEDSGSGLTQLGVGFSSNALLENITAANTVYLLNGNESEYRYQAVFGRINYNYDGKYILNLTGRRDGSSRFGPGNQFANFGALGVAWIFSEEDFLKGAYQAFSFGKLRGSYGTTGNDKIGDYQFLDTYALSGVAYNGIQGLQPTRLFNPDFGWETNRKFEAALELGFFKNRLLLNSAYFRNRSSNQLVGLPLPSTTGFSQIQSNLNATVENKGWEFELNSRNIISENFKWSTAFNISLLQNELISYPDLEKSTYANQYVVGESLNIRKLYENTGVNPDTGVYEFRDFNGDGSISSADDRKYIGRTYPKFFGGLSNSLRYKNWNLDFLFQFVKQDGINYLFLKGVPGTMQNQPTEVLDRWQGTGDTGRFQKFTSGSDFNAINSYYRYAGSDAAISDASFIRLKNIVLRYNIPPSFIKGVSGQLSLKAQNLFTLTDYRGLDPETQSIENLPPLRLITAGISLTF